MVALDLALDTGTSAEDRRRSPAMTIISRRSTAAYGAFDVVKNFYFNSRYGERRGDPGIADFTFGNPHEMLSREWSRRSARARCRRTRTGSPTRPARKNRRHFSPARSAESSAFDSNPRTSPSPPAPSRRSRSPSGWCSMSVTRSSFRSRPGSVTNRCCLPPTPSLGRCR
jgi:hypothetical protein